MNNSSSSMGVLLQGFFLEHLLKNKHASTQTVASYRDTFRLLLQYLHRRLKIEPAKMQLKDLQIPVILDFLENLEVERHNTVQSRNIRLAAIRSFFRWTTLRDPEFVDLATRVLAIPTKRTEHKIVTSLTREEIEALIASPDTTEWKGRRDHALLLTLYNTGIRVSELINLQQDQFQFGDTSFVHIHGKGRKERTVPLWAKTALTIKKWFRELNNATTTAFPSARNTKLTRNGVDYILKQIVESAKVNYPTLGKRRISPHTIRHSTAMHLLQSGVDITVIALWLGHESIETTNFYIEADLEMKERALQKLSPTGKKVPRFKPTDKVIQFLSTL